MNYWLPDIALSDGVLRLPLSHVTAQTLVGLVLATPLPEPTASGAGVPEEVWDSDGAEWLPSSVLQALSQDPAFTLWCTAIAEELRFRRPLTIRHIGTWLLRQAPSLLLPLQEQSDAESQAHRLAWQNLSRASVNDAWNGWEFAGKKGDLVDSPQFLVGLLRHAPAWCAGGGSTTRALPDSVAALLRDAAGLDVPVPDPQVLSVWRPSAWELDSSQIVPWGALLQRGLRQRERVQQWGQRFAEELERSKLAAMKELAYGAGHEINNPLANIGTRAQALLRHERDPERRRQLITINKQVFRAHAMIADMMLFAKPPALHYQPIAVGKMLDRLLRELEDELRDRHIRLHCAAADGLILEGDENQLIVALRAICQNSVDALHEGGEIWIDVEAVAPGGEEAELEEIALDISDNGPGISTNLREQIFDPFFSGREAGRGLGFGLSKAWRIVREHAGRIDVLSSARSGDNGKPDGTGDGVTFRVVLPCGRR